MTVEILEALTEEECYLYAILTDPSGIDLAEFSWYDPTRDDGCFRCYDYQIPWWRGSDQMQIEMSARAIGKTVGILVRMFSFAFCHPGQEALVTAPELVHLEPIIDLIERRFMSQRLGREMVAKPATHRPFLFTFRNGARILGRIPQRDGKGVKGAHPLVLEQEEACFAAGTSVLTYRGLVAIENVKIGDEVFTHQNRWKKVTGTHQYERPTVTVKGQGCPRLETTIDHHFWVKDVDGRDWKTRKGSRKLSNPAWMPVREMLGAFWSSPTSFPEAVIPACVATTGHQTAHNTASPDFAWILGLYLAEGSTASSGATSKLRTNRVYFSIHQKEVLEVRERLGRAGLHSWVQTFSNNAGANVIVASKALMTWIRTEVPGHCQEKQIPVWVLGTPALYRAAVLDGLCYGDGCETSDPRYSKGRRRLVTTSYNLAITARLLGASLGYHTSLYYYPPPKKRCEIRGKSFQGGPSYEVIFALTGQSSFDEDKVYSKVKSITSGLIKAVYDLEVEDDHSFTANGMVVHNSDYPLQGWIELVETLKRGEKDSAWHAHGVTIGVGNEFHRHSEHALGEGPLRPVSHAAEGKFTVHRIPAMAHPDFDEAERLKKRQMYPDESEYRRNVLGLPGDALSPIFRYSQIMRSTEDDLSNYFNTEIFWAQTITDFDINANQRDITNFLHKPAEHERYKTVWLGMDVGMVNDPTEILIAAEVQLSLDERKEMASRRKACPQPGFSRMAVIGRLSLVKISEPAQADVIMWLCENYPVKRFTFDSTGIGLPLFQIVQRQSTEEEPDEQPGRTRPTIAGRRAQRAMKVIKGYNFSSNILVDFDERIELDTDLLDEKIKKQGLERNVKEWSTDECRVYMEENRLWFAWDVPFLKQLEASKYKFTRDQVDRYGRRKRSFTQGEDHCLDALRMLILGHAQLALETFLATPPEDGPVIDGVINQGDFLDYDSYANW